jgi:hypothetical protein
LSGPQVVRQFAFASFNVIKVLTESFELGLGLTPAVGIATERLALGENATQLL